VNTFSKIVSSLFISSFCVVAVWIETSAAAPTATPPGSTASSPAEGAPPAETKGSTNAGAASISTAPTATPSAAPSKSSRIPRIRVGDQLSIEVSDLAKKIQQDPDAAKNARLVLDCKRIADVPPDCVIGNTILFTISRETIEQVTPRTKVAPINLIFEDGKTVSALPDHVQLVLVADDWRLWTVIGILLVGALLLLVYGRYTNLLRDGHPPDETAAHTNQTTFNVLWILPGFSGSMPKRDQLSAYSLAKVQMAWWSFIISAAFLFIWLAVGELNSITSSTVVLFGISLGTTVASRMVSSNKQATAQDLKSKQGGLTDQVNQLQSQVGNAEAKSVPNAIALTQDLTTKKIQLDQTQAQLNQLTVDHPDDAKSKGFLTDIMSDENGISIHRFQMVGWTVILALVFVCGVWSDLKMPEFSDTLLTLMGISSGTYVALKIPEKKAVVA
jgi:hypothetical protein